ncbi:MAG: universal stress protein [Armatimonadota bacterium]
MYRHLLVPVDCTENSRHLAHRVARFAAPLIPCKVTLAAAITPTEDSELRGKRTRHANDALRSLKQLLLQEGIWSHSRVVEGNDHAAALVREALNESELYDLIVLGTYQTLPEDYDAPCKGSFADQICRRTHLPVLVLPDMYEG